MQVAARQKTSNLELLAIYEVSKVLGSSLDLHGTLREVLRLLSYHLQMYRGRVFLQGTDGILRMVAAHGLSNGGVEEVEIREGEGISGRILKTGMPVVVPNLADEPLFIDRGGWRDDLDDQVSSLVGVPIKAAGAAIGVLTIDRISDEGPSANFGSDVRFLSMVANLIGQTVRLHRTVADERRHMMRETFRVQKELRLPEPIADIVGKSPPMLDVLAQVRRVAPFKSTVLIRGESGTGKELIARAIHNLSPRKDGPFIRVNCAALTETLLESELFGHERGAFTGAQKDHKGRFELASGGTLFLDEIGDISSSFQAKLLRVLQEQEFERIGGTRTIKTDVRLICATNLNLEEAVGHGRFRADLYFRINVVSILLPPLRERPGDIAPLARHFVAKFGKDNGMALALDSDALTVLERCPWPGNVRELENCIERAATQSRDGHIRAENLSCSMNLCSSSTLFQYRTAGTSVGGLGPAMGPGGMGPGGMGPGGMGPGGMGAGPGGMAPGRGAASAPAPVTPATAEPPRAPSLPAVERAPANGASWPNCAAACAANPVAGCAGSASLPPPTPVPASAAAAESDPELPEDGGPLRERLLWAMERTGWVQAKAARMLGMTTRQVSYALRKYNIEIKRL